MSPKKYIVFSSHESEFPKPKPITFKKGDPLLIGEEYEGSEGWDNWWLNVLQGELVIGSRTLNGWLWCEKSASTESGWAPLENLQETAE